jgi:hypothetical protein
VHKRPPFSLQLTRTLLSSEPLGRLVDARKNTDLKGKLDIDKWAQKEKENDKVPQ